MRSFKAITIGFLFLLLSTTGTSCRRNAKGYRYHNIPRDKALQAPEPMAGVAASLVMSAVSVRLSDYVNASKREIYSQQPGPCVITSGVPNKPDHVDTISPHVRSCSISRDNKIGKNEQKSMSCLLATAADKGAEPFFVLDCHAQDAFLDDDHPKSQLPCSHVLGALAVGTFVAVSLF